ncbi:FkbM family methyltransferase [Rhodoplanes roseus]|uniref:Methyltransferase FkbM domain-containing protein n=1 Tax=Rhodoplanes roseus TaxID=29409 RepID=A0A327L436_9BRAD|nr:FkbM family methyltransferase [Rhodoplanes roseus]RAI45146.1 hypothetical protein CH341_05475 [Rhodoplanes roseus]
MPEIVVRIAPPACRNGTRTVAAEITGFGKDAVRLWYRIADERPIAEVAVAHAFAVSIINQAMAAGRDLVIEGPLTAGIVTNLHDYQRAFAAWMPETFRPVAVRARTLLPEMAYQPEKRFAVPFSGGLDSCYSARMLSRDGTLGALVSVHGLDVGLDRTDQWNAVATGLRGCAESLGVPLIEVATNWNELAVRLPGYLGYFLPAVAAALLTDQYGGVAIPSSYGYDQLVLPLETNPLTDPLLGRPGFPVRHHGAEAHRIDKVEGIAGWPAAVRQLRPCDQTKPDGTACGRCRKCIHTALTFSALGHPVPESLGGVLPERTLIEQFPLTPYSTLALQEAVAAARRRGATAEWIAAVEERLATSTLPKTAAEQDADELRRRLDYVLGGATMRSGPARLFRRIGRALRGRTGPRGLPAWTAAPRKPQVGPTWAQPEGPAAARSPRGRAIHVDAADLRGRALLHRPGGLDPAASQLWQTLARAEPWTHIVDVGANYGEMLVDLPVDAAVRLIAIEPNPHVCAYLDRTLREAGHAAVLVQAAVGDREGTVALTLDRTWSGLSAASIHRTESAGHRLEQVVVGMTTLARLLDDGRPDPGKRVLVKIDVEGQESAVLAGLGDAARFAAFAALVEIRHLPVRDLETILGVFAIELLETATGALVPVPDATPEHLSGLLATGRFHPLDVVLRPRR